MNLKVFRPQKKLALIGIHDLNIGFVYEVVQSVHYIMAKPRNLCQALRFFFDRT